MALALEGDDAGFLARIAELFSRIEANEQNFRRALELSQAARFLWAQASDQEAWLMNQYDLGVLLL